MSWLEQLCLIPKDYLTLSVWVAFNIDARIYTLLQFYVLMHDLKARWILCNPWGVVGSTSSSALPETPKMVLGDVQICRAISKEVLVLVP